MKQGKGGEKQGRGYKLTWSMLIQIKRLDQTKTYKLKIEKNHWKKNTFVYTGGTTTYQRK